MSTRNGKIARLPRPIRNQLNERLDRSEPGPQLLDWLNALPDVRKVLQTDFAGVPISKQNLSEWRQGGFEEWLARRDLREDARDMTLLAAEMDESGDVELADAAAKVLAARFGGLIANWNGEVDEKFEAKSRILNRLCRSVVQLQRGMHQANREAFELQRLTDEKEKAEEEEIKKRLVRPFFDSLKKPAMARIFGGGAAGRKIAEYILSVRRGNLDADFDILPTDKFEHEEAAAKRQKPVNPTKKRRTARQARKTAVQKVSNPLQENELDAVQEEDSSQAGSNPVKPGQTDLAQLDDAPAASFPNPNPNPNLNLPPPSELPDPQEPPQAPLPKIS